MENLDLTEDRRINVEYFFLISGQLSEYLVKWRVWFPILLRRTVQKKSNPTALLYTEKKLKLGDLKQIKRLQLIDFFYCIFLSLPYFVIPLCIINCNLCLTYYLRYVSFAAPIT